jgi:hypothetical protein
MGKKIVTILVAAVALSAFTLAEKSFAAEALPSKADESCLKCHANYKEPGQFAGRLVEVSRKAKTIQLRIGKDMEVIHFDDATALENAASMPEIPKNEAVRIIYQKKDGKNVAEKVMVKKGLKVPEEQLATAQEVAKLVALGPEKGKYVLLDSRAPDPYNAGHIPTAKSMPFFAFDQLKDKLLPQDKEILQIYYCDGFT